MIEYTKILDVLMNKDLMDVQLPFKDEVVAIRVAGCSDHGVMVIVAFTKKAYEEEGEVNLERVTCIAQNLSGLLVEAMLPAGPEKPDARNN